METEVIEKAAQQVLDAAPARPLATNQGQPPAQSALSVVEYAVQSGAPVDQVRALLELQVRADNHQLELMREKRLMDKADRAEAAEVAYHRDFAAFRGENIIIPKTKHVVMVKRDGSKGPQFDQAEFDEVCRRLSPALAKHGFSFRHDQQFGSRKWTTDGVESDIPWVYVTCILNHKDGYGEKLTLEGPPWDSGAMNDLQKMQSSASFLKRQSLLAISGTATGGEDDEGQRGESGPEVALLAHLITGVQATTTDAAAATFWKSNITQLAAWPEAHEKFKAAVVAHRTALKGKAA